MLAQRDEEIRQVNSNGGKLQYLAGIELRVHIKYY